MSNPSDQGQYGSDDPLVQLVYREGPFGYQPKLAPAVIFSLAFGLIGAGHTWKTLRSKQWWLISLTFGVWLEMLGNTLRAAAHSHQQNDDIYIGQVVILVLTPAFFAAAQFVVLGRVLQILGDEYSLVPSRFVLRFFLTLDLLSIAIQAAGSGIAGTAETDHKDPNPGGNVVVAGLAIQLVGYLLFNLLLVSLGVLSSRKRPTHPIWTSSFKRFLIAVFVSALFIMVRSSFRLAEMIVGWIGYISVKEWLYYVFDATPVCLAVAILLFFNPSDYLHNSKANNSKDIMGEKKESLELSSLA